MKRAAILIALCACSEQGIDGPDAAVVAFADAAVVTASDAAPSPSPDAAAVLPDARVVVQRPRCRTTTIASPPLVPQPGELFLAHIGLGGLSLGEATLAQLPDGRRLLIDIGNDAHADEVLGAIDALLGRRDIDLVVLTHHHADHEDALDKLLPDLTIGTLIHRGLSDLTPAANDANMAEICAARGQFQEIELCGNGDTRCVPDAWSRTATACPAIPYTSGALTLLAANGIAHGAAFRPLEADDSNGENARSVVGLLRHGDFRYVFAGDLTGGGSDTDAVESFYVRTLGAELPPADVLHLSHHARDTSSSMAWLDHLLPADGRPRSAVTGISTAHVGSPHASVVGAVLDHLAGGGLFLSRVAPGGTSTGVVDAAGGTVRILTTNGGASYRVQAVSAAGAVIATRETTSGAACEVR